MSSYAKLPIQEIEARFALARNEPSMRSVTAILRITREQVGARGFLGQYPWAASGAALLAAILIAASFLSPSVYRSKLLPPAIGCVIVAIVLAYGAASGAGERRAALEQERALRRAAAESLDEILAAPFARKPLAWEQTGTLRELAKAHPEYRRLSEFLGANG